MKQENDKSEQVRISAADGYKLAARIYANGSASRRIVVVNSATAVPQRFYRHFAQALADAGYIAVTYDYRGIGGSRPESLRGFDATTRDWALLDMTGVVDWVRAQFDPECLLMVGHSIGGQVTGLLENSDAIDGMLAVAAQSGHWRLQGGEQKYLACVHVHITLPLLAKMLGYMPWSWVGGSEDLPKGAALEWSRWCRDRDYLLGDSTLPLDRYNNFKAPILAYSIDDDKWGTAQAVDAMMSAYPSVERRHLVPDAHGLKQIGHFGYFRPDARVLWEEAIAWFDSI